MKMNCFRHISRCFEYDTTTVVHIESKAIGITYRVLQSLVASYLIGYVIIVKKGYQISASAESEVTTKVKGVIFTNLTSRHLQVPAEHLPLYNRIWDATDYVIPPSGGEYGGFFIMTNVIITPNQTRGICPEDISIHEARCSANADCPKGTAVLIGNGEFTGNCVESSSDRKVKTCEVQAWCPVELDELPFGGKEALLVASQNFTVLIKNAIEFPMFGTKYKRRNIFESFNSTYLNKCFYNPDTDPYCPIFRLGDIVESAGENYSIVAIQGAVFQIGIQWDCDLDWDFVNHCLPKYSFERMDIQGSKISPGWNFRTAKYHEENRRTLFKNYGIKFLVKVSGKAGKFSAVPLFINMGSGVALLGLARIVCDFLITRFMKNKRNYKNFVIAHSSEGPDDTGPSHQNDKSGEGDGNINDVEGQERTADSESVLSLPAVPSMTAPAHSSLQTFRSCC